MYVSAGRAAGLAVGDRLVLGTPPETVAELEVTFLAEHSASCRVLRETRPLKRGDTPGAHRGRSAVAAVASRRRGVGATPAGRADGGLRVTAGRVRPA